jgi:hypothetical protein
MFGPITQPRMTRWVQQWARERHSQHCCYRPMLASQLLLIRQRNGVRDALDFRDRLLRASVYPAPSKFWEPGSPGPSFWDRKVLSVGKLARTKRLSRRFYTR